MADESQDGNTAEGEDPLASPEEPDVCEGSEEPEHHPSEEEEGSGEEEGGEDLAVSTGRMSLKEEEKSEGDTSTMDQSSKGRHRMH